MNYEMYKQAALDKHAGKLQQLLQNIAAIFRAHEMPARKSFDSVISQLTKGRAQPLHTRNTFGAAADKYMNNGHVYKNNMFKGTQNQAYLKLLFKPELLANIKKNMYIQDAMAQHKALNADALSEYLRMKGGRSFDYDLAARWDGILKAVQDQGKKLGDIRLNGYAGVVPKDTAARKAFGLHSDPSDFASFKR